MTWSERRETWSVPANDARDPFSVDYGRIIHSGSFRRLQGKTQILNLGESDFYRTRLTHSLEVAQIAAGLTRQLKKNDINHAGAAYLPEPTLIQAIGLTHDLGHPPFGHGGEIALNYCMRNSGGFEGNGQTLRILSSLEKYSKKMGANLTRRTLLGALKYPVTFSRLVNPELRPRLVNTPTTLSLIDREASKPPKCFMDCEIDVVDWILDPLSRRDREQFTSSEKRLGKHAKPLHKSLDCSIMDVADDIAYGVHDLEDALALRLINEDQFRDYVPLAVVSPFIDSRRERHQDKTQEQIYDDIVKKLFGDGYERKHAISRLVGFFIIGCSIETHAEFDEPLIRYRATMEKRARAFLEALKKLITILVIKSPAVQQLEFKGQRIVIAMFEAFQTEPRSFLPRDAQITWADSPDKLRVLCDHVAGMTDPYLLRVYDRLFSPRMGSIFEKL